MTPRAFRSASRALLIPLALCGAAQNACSRRETPSKSETTRQAMSGSSAPSRAPRVELPKSTDPAAEGTGTDEDDTNAAALAHAAKVPLLDEQGAPLPQTEICPEASSSTFQARMRLLLLAIVKDNPDLALPSLLPLVAYQQVKAIANPERDYRNRLLRAFARDIHQAHSKLGANSDGSEFVAIEVQDSDAHFINPGSEGNKLGYFRVLRSRLTYRDATSAVRSLDVASLISWRGEWYVMDLLRGG